MILISHRGNTNGKFESYENEPTYIDKAISEGFDVEVDIWVLAGILFLGHDRPQYGIDYNWLQERKNKLWIHCKNIEALQFCDDRLDLHYFWHENDTVTLTSQSTIWAYPGKQPIKNSIAVMPELYGDNIIECLGVCSDFIKRYQK
jgi:hypothetical protein